MCLTPAAFPVLEGGTRCSTPTAHQPCTPDIPCVAICHFAAADVKQELLKLNKGLLFIYIDLLHILVHNPSQYADMVTVAITCLQNMQHLISRLRPEQVGAWRSGGSGAAASWCLLW